MSLESGFPPAETNPQEQFLQRVSEATEIDHLLEALDEVGVIDSEQQPGNQYTAEDQKAALQKVRDNFQSLSQDTINNLSVESPMLNGVTSAGGLRDKFLELLKEGKR